MGKIMEKVRSAFKRPKRSKSIQKQIDRWEGEGGSLPPEDLGGQGSAKS